MAEEQEEKGEQEAPKVEAPKAEAPKVEAPKVEAPKAKGVWINLSEASPLSVADAGALPQSLKNLILRAAAKIAEADKAANVKAKDEELARVQHDQSLTGRKERQAAAAAK